ncbi:hypothetical protein [Nocardia blacklockiae]|uniref:hypothetical protein n=1 Tax=Nocardia blacklockiae TaxID=480036 RepID=UPI001895F906|nr:hypothetical protein [Nocardia blacklockiae]MBF6176642.1 hypothetical protein [Nocardia blacklockiae]
MPPGQLSADETKALLSYQLLHARINETDAKMWQVPSLTLTAQAFLLTITLSADFKLGSHIVSASMGVLISALSLQLMAKHRHFHRLDTAMLNYLEQRFSLYKLSTFSWPTDVVEPPKHG